MRNERNAIDSGTAHASRIAKQGVHVAYPDACFGPQACFGRIRAWGSKELKAAQREVWLPYCVEAILGAVVPYVVAGVELGGVRTVLMVPMLKDDVLVGAFVFIATKFGHSQTGRLL
jgi:hypothetical protein